MTIHREEIKGIWYATATRGEFTAKASSSCPSEAYFAAIELLNEKAKGVYAPQ